MPLDQKNPIAKPEDFANLGTETLAYVREISGLEIHTVLPQGVELDEDGIYWGLFAADGQPLMFADQAHQVFNEAFYNDLQAVRLN